MDAPYPSTIERVMARRWPEWLPVAATLTIVGWLHAAGLNRPFFADDYLFLEQVRGQSLLSALSSPDPIGNFARPVGRQLYFWLISRIGGESPAVFHLVGLALFLGILLAFHRLARRFLDPAMAWFALAFVALHYAADVPVRWASGGQDLLAILFGLGVVLWTCSGRHGIAALALLLGLLSKETAVTAVIIAPLAARRDGERLHDAMRRSWALFVVAAAWGSWRLAWAWNQEGQSSVLQFAPSHLISAILHLAEVAAGIEPSGSGGGFRHWSLSSFAPAVLVAAIGLLAYGRGRDSAQTPPSTPNRLLILGPAWAALGMLVAVPVMHIWSAYFFLWGLFGVALVAAALARTLEPATRVACLAAFVLTSTNTRALDEFSVGGGAWSWQSHVNAHYIERSTSTVEAYLRQMRESRPHFPPNSTVFFADVPPSAGFQTADGPLLRWAYRDPSLRSFFVTQFSRERAMRGPVFFFAAVGDSLHDRSEDSQLLPSLAFSSILSDKPGPARDALDVAIGSGRTEPRLFYWRGLVRMAQGDTVGCRADLVTSGMRPEASPTPAAIPPWLEAHRDTARRISLLTTLRDRHPMDPNVHARLTALLLARGVQVDGAIEAYAFRTLAPDSADAWRKWASAQLGVRKHEQGLASLERYLTLTRARGVRDLEAEHVAADLRRFVHGDVARSGLRK